MSKRPTGARTRPSDFPRGVDLLSDPLLNKGTAFTPEERDALGLRGLLPPRPADMNEQIARVMTNYRAKPNDLERYIYLTSLHDRNETLFYRVVVDHIEELLPIIYTPTVGRACQVYGQIFRRARGLFVTADDRDRVKSVLSNWPHADVRAIVVTDGERILGLGDLGANGMGIPVGKLALYTACAGVHPAVTLPVTLDVGTDNESLLDAPLYLGLRRHRMRGAPYDALVEEFVTAANELWPGVLIQFEDFGNQNAFRLLAKYRERVCSFNDDIQGTAAVTLAGVFSALRVTGGDLRRQRFLFLGAGEAGVGIADLIVSAMVDAGMSREDARRACWLVDSHGLVVRSRKDLAEHKRPYAHEAPGAANLLDAIRALEPTALIGVSGQPSTFTREILEAMAKLNERPIVFALSNPTANSECTAEEAYTHTGGRALFASGSPFATVTFQGKQMIPSQANNAYVFPGVALGIVASRIARVTDEMFARAARTLAGLVSKDDLANGLLFPPLPSLRGVSLEIAAAVARVAFERGLAGTAEPRDLKGFIREQVFDPEYQSYV
ncbi:MAG TPA: NAD-dependent malic enzyme [Candidatus Krumholzibacteria bacterium]|nr:NAD-dependent malic enzyme [Candidatus Krumholzibacteria bacterium]